MCVAVCAIIPPPLSLSLLLLPAIWCNIFPHNPLVDQQNIDNLSYKGFINNK